MSLARRSSRRPSSSPASARRFADDEERRRSRAPPPDTSGSDGTWWARGGAQGLRWCAAADGGLALGSAVAAMVVATRGGESRGGSVRSPAAGAWDEDEAAERSPASQRFLVAGAGQARRTERGDGACGLGAVRGIIPRGRTRASGPVGGLGKEGMRPEPPPPRSVASTGQRACEPSGHSARAPITSAPPGRERSQVTAGPECQPGTTWPGDGPIDRSLLVLDRVFSPPCGALPAHQCLTGAGPAPHRNARPRRPARTASTSATAQALLACAEVRGYHVATTSRRVSLLPHRTRDQLEPLIDITLVHFIGKWGKYSRQWHFIPSSSDE